DRIQLRAEPGEIFDRAAGIVAGAAWQTHPSSKPNYHFAVQPGMAGNPAYGSVDDGVGVVAVVPVQFSKPAGMAINGQCRETCYSLGLYLTPIK
ncbi:hypothetical protein, partial [Rhodopseudomonas palustris]|uniref:hypothetical protein n=1 Tax=Rhodopseudomonas palustris TaxID=1076 RepID=UPI001AEC0067